MIVALYLIFFIVPYADKNGFFNENNVPNYEEVKKYIFLCIPVVIGYILFSSIYIRKTSFLKSLIYPLFIANIYLGFWLSLLAMGGAILWLMIPTIIFPIIALPISFHKGRMKDIQYKFKDE
ncbi:hypothetical protein ASG85_33085 [Paenibacillus sp. Soil724D2]|nr:hypothetical protein ASG85_33085 [Paenibacillus sp. Soil724D2]